MRRAELVKMAITCRAPPRTTFGAADLELEGTGGGVLDGAEPKPDIITAPRPEDGEGGGGLGGGGVVDVFEIEGVWFMGVMVVFVGVVVVPALAPTGVKVWPAAVREVGGDSAMVLDRGKVDVPTTRTEVPREMAMPLIVVAGAFWMIVAPLTSSWLLPSGVNA